MNEAQIGLLVATPVLLAFIAFMYRQGAMPRVGAVMAAFMTTAISAMLFLSH